MPIAAIGRADTPARRSCISPLRSVAVGPLALLHQPAAVGGGLITPCVIYLLSRPIARTGSNPSTFAAPIDPHRTRGGIEIPGDAATPAAAALKHQAIAIHPVNLHNDPTTASVSAPASYHKRYKNTVKRRRFFQLRKSIV